MEISRAKYLTASVLGITEICVGLLTAGGFGQANAEVNVDLPTNNSTLGLWLNCKMLLMETENESKQTRPCLWARGGFYLSVPRSPLSHNPTVNLTNI